MKITPHNARMLVTGVLVVTTIGGYLLTRDLVASLSVAGTLASVVGVLVALYQIEHVEELTAATNKAVSGTRERMRHVLTIADASRSLKLTEQIQGNLGSGNLELARVRIQELHHMLVQFREYEYVAAIVNQDEYRQTVTQLRVDSDNLFQALNTPTKEPNLAVINRHLLAARSSLSAIESHLRFKEA